MSEHRASRWSGTGKRSVQASNTRRDATVTVPAVVETQPEATAAAKELAAEHNVDLETIAGTGAEGRITKADVETVVEAEPEPEPEPEPDVPDEEPEDDDSSAQQTLE